MREIKWAEETIDGNIREARRYIRKAYEMRESNKPAADWCREMAAAHISFNTTGHNLVKGMIAEAKTETDTNEYTAGMMAVWKDRHADLMSESAEVKAMIDAYK